MNMDRLVGAWHQIKGKLKGRWGRLTDDDLRELEGRSEELAGKLQQRYGFGRDEAQRRAHEFLSQLQLM
jgi:uncharacterized protein YjbJ (UPF0337 family)